ncbi:hypothetical protein V6Z12_A04G048700 [Gossypium hirsutum]
MDSKYLLAAPTNDINTTVALALLTSVAYFYAGLSKKGLGYFSKYIQPTPILLPINILEDFTKPLSLSFRLFGNILADELVVVVLVSLVPSVVPQGCHAEIFDLLRFKFTRGIQFLIPSKLGGKILIPKPMRKGLPQQQSWLLFVKPYKKMVQ